MAAVDESDPRVIEARARTEAIKAELDRGRQHFLYALIRGYPPDELADELVARWREFEAEHPDPGLLVPLWQHVYGPQVEAIRAWPRGAYADAILAEDDELARLFRQRFPS